MKLETMLNFMVVAALACLGATIILLVKVLYLTRDPSVGVVAVFLSFLFVYDLRLYFKEISND